MFGRDSSVTTTFNAKDNMSPVVRGIRRTMDDFKRDAKQGFGLAGGISVFNLATQAIGKATDYMAVGVTMAADLAEQQSKVNAVFGEGAQEIRDFAQSSSTNLRMSERAALSFMGTTGNLFDSLGVGAEDAIDMSKGLAQLAADLASFNNAEVKEVIIALQSGLVGETEPMRRFGANLSAARVEAEALRLGLAKTKNAITDSMKVTARYSLIMADTANAHGDAARTADGAAGSWQQLNAELEDVQTELGGALLPVVQELTLGLKDMLGILGINDKAAKDWSVTLAEAAGVAEGGGDSIAQLRDGVQALNDILQPQVDEAADFAKSLSTMAEAAGVSERAIMDMFMRLKDNAKMGSEGAKAAIREYIRSLYLAETNTLMAETVITGAWTGLGETAKRTGASIYGGLVRPTRRAMRDMFKTATDAKEPWKGAMRALAQAGKDPFSDEKFATWMERKAEKFVRNARRAYRQGKGDNREAAKALAYVMTNPILVALAETQEEIEDLANAAAVILDIQKRIGGFRRNGTGPATGGGGGGGGAHQPSTGTRAFGGPVEAGETYLVGENGPELLHMGTSGHVNRNGGGCSHDIYLDGQRMFRWVDGRSGRAIAMGGA